MKTLEFSIEIDAPKTKVWEALWNDESYKKWTSVFSNSSHAVSDWQEGSKILFIDDNKDGLSAIIDKKIPNERMTFKYLGEMKNGEEIVNEWTGALEDYRISEKNGGTELKVIMDVTDEFEGFFNETFNKALNIIKDISEN
jgi:Activator of Hsp90 ATPase homolog 1-like protein